MRGALVLLALFLAGCGAPAPPAGATLDLALDPLVLRANGTLEALATVSNPGFDTVVIGAGCSDIADLEIRYPDGRRLGANATGCAMRDEPNTLAPGASAGRRVTWPPAFWANHPEAPPGLYTVVATTTWRTAEGEPQPVEARATFRWTG